MNFGAFIDHPFNFDRPIKRINTVLVIDIPIGYFVFSLCLFIDKEIRDWFPNLKISSSDIKASIQIKV